MNRRISNLLWVVTAIEVGVVLVSGAGLFFFPDFFTALWTWDLLPFNTRFVGAVYLSAMIPALALVITPNWSVGRLVVPMIAIFTIIVMVLSSAYFELFTGPLFAVVLWFILYIAIPVNAVYHLWLYRNEETSEDIVLPAWMTYWLIIQAVLLGIYGMALLIVPQMASAFWTWGLDNFHAQLYSVTFLTPALGTFLLYRKATKHGLLIMGITDVALGLLPIIGLYMVDLAIQRVTWTSINTWMWFGLFAYLIVSGVMMLYLSATDKQVATSG